MKINKIFVFILLSLVVSCTTNNSKLSNNTSDKPTLKMESKDNKKFAIISRVPFSYENGVPDNVKTECTEIGSQFSNSIAKYAERNGIMILQKEELLSVEKNIVILNIQSVYSAGNAFIGHNKSVTVIAKLLTDGNEVARKSFTRNSRGGFLGGFKGSCSVLAHTVNTLGNDVGKWLRNF